MSDHWSFTKQWRNRKEQRTTFWHRINVQKSRSDETDSEIIAAGQTLKSPRSEFDVTYSLEFRRCQKATSSYTIENTDYQFHVSNYCRWWCWFKDWRYKIMYSCKMFHSVSNSPIPAADLGACHNYLGHKELFVCPYMWIAALLVSASPLTNISYCFLCK